MTRTRNGSNGWMAKFVAVLFAVQVAMAAFSIGAAAAPVPRDQFGNVLCQADSHSGHADRAGKGHENKLDCCRSGCPVGPERLEPPVPIVLSDLSRESAADLAVPREPAFQPAKGFGKKRARAPPAVA